MPAPAEPPRPTSDRDAAPAPAPGCPAPVLAAALRAHQALLELLDVAALETTGKPVAALGPAPLSLHWRAAGTPEELADQALRELPEAVSEPHPVVAGQVYCYACSRADCDHAKPPGPGMVFAGYESTGRPGWMEFFNLLLELGDARADRLFLDPPELLARVLGRPRLVAAQLSSFGRNSWTYRVWGQVVAGYLPVRRLRAALTVQIVETKSHHLHLQTLADPLLREALADAPEDRRSAFARVYDALAEARRQVLALSPEWHLGNRRAAAEATREKAFAILRHLAHSLEQKGRQQRRRTSHAEIRGGQNRPIHKAYDDVVAAASTDFLHDRFKQSLIVVGRGGRIHAFSAEGRHITSLTLPGDEFTRRCQRGRYQPCPEATAETLRASILAALPASAEADPEPT